MSAYFIVDNRQVHDLEKVSQYIREVPSTVEAFGGKYVVVNGKFEVLEGSWQPTSLVMIEFPSLEKAKEWYHSDIYQKVKAYREGASEGDMVLVTGLDEQSFDREHGL